MDAHESLIAAALDRLGEGFAIFDGNDRLVACNKVFRDLRDLPEALCRPGMTLEELIRFNAERGDFGPGDPELLIVERMAEIMQAEDREVEREMADGKILAIRYQRLDDGGRVMTLQDRTAERASQAAEALSRERLSLVSRASSDGLYDWNITDDSLEVSNRLNELFGFEASQLSSRIWFERVHPDDRAGYRDAMLDCFQNRRERFSCEYRIMTGREGLCWTRDQAIAMYDDQGRAYRLVGAISDISEIKESEAELAAARDEAMAAVSHFNDAIESLTSGFVLYDSDDRIRVVNSAFREIFSDLGEDAAIGVSFHDMTKAGYLQGRYPQAGDDFDGYFAALQKKRFSATETRELRMSSGVWLHVIERPTSDGGLVGIYTDITDAKRRESDVAQARDEAINAVTRFDDAIESLTSGFVLFDSEDRIVVVNTKFREFFQDLADTIKVGNPFREVVRAGIERGLFPWAGDDPEVFLNELMARRRNPEQMREQLMADGLWLQVNERRTADGGLVAIYTDISEVKRSESELAQARDEAVSAVTLFNDAIEALPSGFILYDSEDRIAVVNSNFREYFRDFGDRVTVGAHFRDMMRAGLELGLFPLAGDDGEAFVDKMVERRRNPTEPREQRIAGDIWVQINERRTSDGGLVAVYTDISEVKNQQERFRSILENSPIGVGVLSMDSEILYHNPRFAAIYGVEGEDLVGRSSKSLVTDWQARDEAYAVFKERGILRDHEFLYNKFAGDDQVWTFTTWVATEYEGQPARLTWVYDITGQKQNQQALVEAKEQAEAALADLRQAQDRLVQAEKMASLGQLTAGIAHEIKNPLNFVNNFAKLSGELLDEFVEVTEPAMDHLGEEDRDDAEDLVDTLKINLSKIEEHGKRADSIIKNMLLHSRDGPAESRTVAINELVEESLNLAYHGARAENQEFNVTLDRRFAEDAGEVEAFAQDLTRVFLNLMTNGFYATAKRAENGESGYEPTLTVSSAATDKGVEVRVRDNGTGMPPEVREKLFTPFFTTKPAGEGTGLGLSLSYDIVVKQHGGGINVASEPGAFTEFTVTLPRALPGGGSQT